MISHLIQRMYGRNPTAISINPPIDPPVITGINHNIGVNIAWLEFGYMSPIKQHAIWDNAHIESTLQHYADIELGLIRLPFLWERIQPVLNQPLDPAHLGIIRNFMDACETHGLKVLLDVHNYTRYNSNPTYEFTNATGTLNVGDTLLAYADNTKASLRANCKVVALTGNVAKCSKFQLISPVLTGGKLGTYLETSGGFSADVLTFTGETGIPFGHADLPESAFNDLWIRLATEFKDHQALAGYDIMNEPASIPSVGAENGSAIWKRYAQSCIYSIRTVDTTTAIYVEGYGYAAGHQWQANNPTLFEITDPSNNIIWSFHNYLNRSNDGNNFVWNEVETEYLPDWSPTSITPDIGVQRASAMVAWAAQNGIPSNKLHWGELGASYDNVLVRNSAGQMVNSGVGWNEALEKSLTYAKTQGIKVTGWAAGHQWGNYGYLLEPVTYQSSTQSQLQIGIYRKVYEKVGGRIFDTGSVVAVPNASVTITVYLRGYIEQPIVIDLAVSGIATVSSNQITIPSGLNPQATYTITSSEGASTITYSRIDGGQVPPVRGFSASVSPIESSLQLGVYSFNKEVGSYTGNALVAYRETTGDTQEFPFNGSQVGDTIDYNAILAWANGETVRAVLKDQSGLNRHMRARTWTGNGQGVALAAMDWPLLELDPVNNEPALRFNASGNTRVELPIPIRLKNKLTQIVRAYPQNGNTILGWDSTDNYTLTATSHTLSFDSDGDPDEPSKTLAVNAPTNQWTTITISDDRTQDIGTFGSFGKRSSYRDATKVAETNNFIANLSLTTNSPINQANVGWFVFYEPGRFSGYIRSIVILEKALTETEVALVHSQLS